MIKQCTVCGKEFTARHGNQQICSDECKKKRDREYSKQYYKQHREYCLEKTKKWQQQHPERVRELKRNWWAKNCEGVKRHYRFYPCLKYKDVPAEICLNCSALECRYET